MPKTEVDLIIEHAQQLVTSRGHSQRPATGEEMQELAIIEDGAVAIKGENIAAVGKSSEIGGEYSAHERIDASAKVVTPGLIDAHTHFVFAGSRENELELKIKGAGYLEILQKGGGILRTVRDTRGASKSQLLQICLQRSRNLLLHGTTTIEAKSGYGLTLNDEIKSLEVIDELNGKGPLTLVPTFLGAHAVPPEYEGKVPDFVTEVAQEWVKEIAKRKLAEFCDVFCEKNVFEIEASRTILEAGQRAGLLARIHADELYPLGGAELAATLGAVSADHLLYASERGIQRMAQAGVIATLLPAAPLTLMLDRYADARRMISEGVAVALGSDLSPSCWLENYQLVLALACYKLKMTPAEAITAATINAAHSVRRGHEIGSIEPGKKADIAIFEAPDYKFLAYRIGMNQISTVVKNGKIVVKDRTLVV
ncbi:MAG: imidazolonepropionase [Candidatus Bathyarchaeia archaeon]